MPSPRRPPLEGVRVADFTWVWAGPFCTLQLAHLGAEVVRVESMNRVCVTRLLPPWLDGEPGINRSGYFNQFNQGKLSLSLDLKRPEAVRIAKELVSHSDIVCENFAAGVMDRLGLGYAELSKIRPDLIMIALSGYGASGPDREFVSYGPAQVPLSGMSSLTGYPGWRPMHVGISYGDPNAGLHGAVAVLAALLHRQKTGKGQYIDLSQWETTIAVLPEGLMDQAMNGRQPARSGNRVPHMAPHGVFPCLGTDRWIALATRSDEEWVRLAHLIGGAALAADGRFLSLAGRKRHEDDLESLIAEWTRQRAPEHVSELLQAERIPAFPPMTNKDLAEDPHLEARDFFVRLGHPEVGALQHVGIPWKLSGSPVSVRRSAPCLGQDTEYVMRHILRYAPAEIDRLRAENVLF